MQNNLIEPVDNILKDFKNIFYFKDLGYLMSEKYINKVQILVVLKDTLLVVKVIDEDKKSFEEINEEYIKKEEAHAISLIVCTQNKLDVMYAVVNLKKKNNDPDPRFKGQFSLDDFRGLIERMTYDYSEQDNKEIKALFDMVLDAEKEFVDYVSTHDLKALGIIPGIIS